MFFSSKHFNKEEEGGGAGNLVLHRMESIQKKNIYISDFSIPFSISTPFPHATLFSNPPSCHPESIFWGACTKQFLLGHEISNLYFSLTHSIQGSTNCSSAWKLNANHKILKLILIFLSNYFYHFVSKGKTEFNPKIKFLE